MDSETAVYLSCLLFFIFTEYVGQVFIITGCDTVSFSFYIVKLGIYVANFIVVFNNCV